MSKMDSKKIVAYFSVIIIIFSFISCIKAEPKKIYLYGEQTDLSGIRCDEIQLGDNISDLNLEKYTLSDRFLTKKNTINFEEWRISYNENRTINKINANFDDIIISINSVVECKTIKDVIVILGENYNSKWYDKEQGLMQAIYFDLDHKLYVRFIFDNINKQLVWIEIDFMDSTNYQYHKNKQSLSQEVIPSSLWKTSPGSLKVI